MDSAQRPTHMIAADILECPCCARPAWDHRGPRLKHGHRNTAWVECAECGLRTREHVGMTEQEADDNAIRAWNRRHGN
jgi:hypothetical protein